MSRPPEVCGSNRSCTRSGSHIRRNARVGTEVLRVGAAPAGHVVLDQRSNTGQQRNRRRLELEGAVAGRGHLRRVADEAETGHVGARVHGVGGQTLQRFGSHTVQCGHRAHGGRHHVRGARSNLSAVEMMPVPRALVSSSSSPGLAPAFDQIVRREHFSRHRVAELDLGVLQGVPAEQRDAGLGELVEAAFEDRAQRSSGRHLSGNAAIASAVSGRPPMA